MSDLDEIFDSASGQFSTRLFTPTEINIKETDSFSSLVNEMGRINRIYLNEFDVCCDELKNIPLNNLVNELILLSNEQAYNLLKCSRTSTFDLDINQLKNIRESIQKIDTNYRNMIFGLYLQD